MQEFPKGISKLIFPTESRYCSMKRYFPLQQKILLFFHEKFQHFSHCFAFYKKIYRKKFFGNSFNKNYVSSTVESRWKWPQNKMQEFIKLTFSHCTLVKILLTPPPMNSFFDVFFQSFQRFSFNKDSRKSHKINFKNFSFKFVRNFHRLLIEIMICKVNVDETQDVQEVKKSFFKCPWNTIKTPSVIKGLSSFLCYLISLTVQEAEAKD